MRLSDDFICRHCAIIFNDKNKEGTESGCLVKWIGQSLDAIYWITSIAENMPHIIAWLREESDGEIKNMVHIQCQMASVICSQHYW